jgi:hypothetical protein
MIKYLLTYATSLLFQLAWHPQNSTQDIRFSNAALAKQFQ